MNWREYESLPEVRVGGKGDRFIFRLDAEETPGMTSLKFLNSYVPMDGIIFSGKGNGSQP